MVKEKLQAHKWQKDETSILIQVCVTSTDLFKKKNTNLRMQQSPHQLTFLVPDGCVVSHRYSLTCLNASPLSAYPVKVHHSQLTSFVVGASTPGLTA